MKKYSFLLLLLLGFSTSMFSQNTIPTDASFYVRALEDMVNLYDTMYAKDGSNTFSYLNLPDTLIKKCFNKSKYQIKDRKISILSEKQLDKIIKKKKSISFTWFYPEINDDGLLEISISFKVGDYGYLYRAKKKSNASEKRKVYKYVVGCAFYSMLYEYNHKLGEWEYIGYEKCAPKGRCSTQRYLIKDNQK